MEGENIQGGVCESQWLCRSSIQVVDTALCCMMRTTSIERSETKRFGFVSEWGVCRNFSMEYVSFLGLLRSLRWLQGYSRRAGWFLLAESTGFNGNSMKYTKHVHEHLCYIADPDGSWSNFYKPIPQNVSICFEIRCASAVH